MTTGNMIALAGLALGYYTLQHTKQTAVQNRYYAGLRLQVVDAQLKGNILTVFFHLDNPNSQSVVLRSVVGDVFINDKKVGNVRKYGTFVVPGNSGYKLSVDVQLKFVNTALAIVELFKKGSKANIHFVGTMNVNNVPEPVDVKYQVT